MSDSLGVMIDPDARKPSTLNAGGGYRFRFCATCGKGTRGYKGVGGGIACYSHRDNHAEKLTAAKKATKEFWKFPDE